MPTNADQYFNEDNKIIISKKNLMVILGILFTGISSLGGFAWSLYTGLKENQEKMESRLIEEIKILQKEEVKPNTNNIQDNKYTIGRLLERTNSRYYSSHTNEVTRPVNPRDTNLPPVD